MEAGDPKKAYVRLREEDVRFRKRPFLDIIVTNTVDEIAKFWLMGNYPMMSEQKCGTCCTENTQWVANSQKIYDEGYHRREEKRKEFENDLDYILVLNPKDWRDKAMLSRSKESDTEDIAYMEALRSGS